MALINLIIREDQRQEFVKIYIQVTGNSYLQFVNDVAQVEYNEPYDLLKIGHLMAIDNIRLILFEDVVRVNKKH